MTTPDISNMDDMDGMDWFGLMRGITEMHVKSLELDNEVAATAGDYSSATKGQCAGSGTGGGEHPVGSSPLYLMASEIVDLVEFDHQYRAEEAAAAKEGELIEASVYPDPASDRSFA